MTNEGGGGCMRDSPRSPTVKTNGSSREGNRIINPHSRIPKSTNKQTNISRICFEIGRYCTYGCTHQTPTVEAAIAVLGHRTLRGANYHCSYSSIPNTMETHGTKRPQEPKYSRLWPLLNLLGRGHPDPTPHP